MPEYVLLTDLAAINPRYDLAKNEAVPFLEMAKLPVIGSRITTWDQRVFTGGGARFQNGDTLFARITPCTENGKIGFVDFLSDGQTAFGSTEFTVISPKDGNHPQFLYYLCSSRHVRAPAIESMIGSTGRQRVPNWIFKNIKVACFSFAEQERIAEILSSVDDGICATEAVIAQAERVKYGLMEDLLTGGLGSKVITRGDVPEGWRASRLGDVCAIQAGAGFPIKHQGRTGEKYPFYKVSDMNSAGNEIFMNNANNTVSEEVRVELGAKILPAGAVIFPKIGAAIATNKKRIVTRDSLVDNNVIGIVAQSGKVSERYLFYIMLAKNLSDFASTAGVPSIRKSTLEEFIICLPDIRKQNEIANTLSSVDELFATNLATVNQLRRLKRGLMDDLLTGRVRTIS